LLHDPEIGFLDHGYEYDVAISFAGADRSVAREIADALTEKHIKVFYDEFEKTTLWGTNLYEHFVEIYSKHARFCIMLVSKHYPDSVWPRVERHSIQSRALKEEGYMLPIRLDDAEVPGLLDTMGFISLENTTIEEIAQMTFSKLQEHNL